MSQHYITHAFIVQLTVSYTFWNVFVHKSFKKAFIFYFIFSLNVSTFTLCFCNLVLLRIYLHCCRLYDFIYLVTSERWHLNFCMLCYWQAYHISFFFKRKVVGKYHAWTGNTVNWNTLPGLMFEDDRVIDDIMFSIYTISTITLSRRLNLKCMTWKKIITTSYQKEYLKHTIISSWKKKQNSNGKFKHIYEFWKSEQTPINRVAFQQVILCN